MSGGYYAVVGRICGDDEDSVLAMYAYSREEAVNEFKQWLWSLDGSSPEAIAEMEAADQGVFVNYVLMSSAPILELNHDAEFLDDAELLDEAEAPE